ncbi:MAG TPA: hypothetical protein GXX37_15740 [Clostridiaceae bacterium]|nr:hypothetical protein [Clostridiaceae bacterium]
MVNIIVSLIFLVVLSIIVGIIVLGLRKSASGLKIMLLGINITLFGGIIAVDPNSNLAGIEYLIALSGLIVSIIGLMKKD